MFLALKIAYDGSRFSGFASNFHGDSSVASALTIALKRLGVMSNFVASGRTDKDVHATSQIISLEIQDFWEISKFVQKLNQKLPKSIKITYFWEVSSSFHARFSAKIRKYRYVIARSKIPVFFQRYVFDSSCENWSSQESQAYASKNSDELFLRFKSALKLFEGKFDFAFLSKKGDFKTSIREIYRICVYKRRIFGYDFWIITFSGNAFLYSQIRMILGSVFAFLRNELTLCDLRALLNKQRRVNFTPASPNGLYLCGVGY